MRKKRASQFWGWGFIGREAGGSGERTPAVSVEMVVLRDVRWWTEVVLGFVGRRAPDM